MSELAAPSRCFGDGSELYADYHDHEWGVAVHGDTELFERLSLEIFAAGLSWLLVLSKRENFRRAFDGFDPRIVATYDAAKIAELATDASIVRNQTKIEAVIANARCVCTLQDSGNSLDELIWSHQPVRALAPADHDQVPASCADSDALLSELKHLGFRWVGPVSVYSLFQACGLVNDHLRTCRRSIGGADPAS